MQVKEGRQKVAIFWFSSWINFSSARAHYYNYFFPDDYDQADPSYEPIEEEDYEMAEDEEQETKVGILWKPFSHFSQIFSNERNCWAITLVIITKYLNWHSSKSIWVIKLSFGQNDSPMRESFWQKDRLITQILFELCLLWYLAQSTLFLDTL